MYTSQQSEAKADITQKVLVNVFRKVSGKMQMCMNNCWNCGNFASFCPLIYLYPLAFPSVCVPVKFCDTVSVKLVRD